MPIAITQIPRSLDRNKIWLFEKQFYEKNVFFELSKIGPTFFFSNYFNFHVFIFFQKLFGIQILKKSKIQNMLLIFSVFFCSEIQVFRNPDLFLYQKIVFFR